MRIGSLFSGIGGLELGLERAGVGSVVWQCEIDPFCRRVLEKHWPGVRRYEDIKKLNNPEPVDLICGGFPCQDISSAGKGAGLDGKRSGLWFEFSRVVSEIQPRWVVVENVGSGANRWVDAVRADLERKGYATLPIPLSAEDVGAPHLRRRIFIIGHSHSHSQPAVPEYGEAPGVQGNPKPAAGASSEQIWEQQGRCSRESGQGPRVLGDHGAQWSDANANEAGLQGADPVPRPKTWKIAAGGPWATDTVPQPAIRRMDDGLPPRMDRNNRLKALGNAVVPQCAEVIGHIVLELAGASDIANWQRRRSRGQSAGREIT